MMGGPASPAQKMGKNEAIGMMNSDLRAGRIKAVVASAAHLIKEWASLVWTDDEKSKISKHQANHASDAALYAWRAHRAYLAKALPAAKTAEDLEREAQERRLQQAARKNRR
jgi:hypothetical protein